MEVPADRSSQPEARAERRLARTLHHISSPADEANIGLEAQRCKVRRHLWESWVENAQKSRNPAWERK